MWTWCLESWNGFWIALLSHVGTREASWMEDNEQLQTLVSRLLQWISSTFGWWSWWSLAVCTVVVEKVVVPNPFELVHLISSQGLVLRRHPPAAGLGHAAGSVAVVNTAGVDVEGLVGGDERSVGPVQLHPAVVCSPVLSVPDCAVDPHRLGVRVWNSYVLVVFEHSDGCVVHIEPAMWVTSTREMIRDWQYVDCPPQLPRRLKLQ